MLDKIGTLKVLAQLPNSKKNTHFKTLCFACGREAIMTGSHLNRAKSCRCQRHVTHGQSQSITYASWEHMIQRCLNEKNEYFWNYGGRGIRVYEPWRDYSVFVMVVGERPSLAYTLERLDTNGHYEPGNVIWATRKQQQNNRRDIQMLTFLDKTLPVTVWAELLGRSATTIRTRKLRGWTDEETLSLPAQKGKKPKRQ